MAFRVGDIVVCSSDDTPLPGLTQFGKIVNQVTDKKWRVRLIGKKQCFDLGNISTSSFTKQAVIPDETKLSIASTIVIDQNGHSIKSQKWKLYSTKQSYFDYYTH